MAALASGAAQAAAADPTPAELREQIRLLQQQLEALKSTVIALESGNAGTQGNEGDAVARVKPSSATEGVFKYEYASESDYTTIKSTNAFFAGKGSIAIGDDANAVADSIVIGNKASTVDAERTSGQSVALGNSAHAGAKGVAIGYNVNASGAREGTVAIGANVDTRSLYSTVVGTDSKIIIDDTKGTWVGQDANIQGGLSSITGSKNTLTSDRGLVYGGMVTSIAGSANTVVNSNGVTVQGFANKVANAYLDLGLTEKDVYGIATGDYSFAQTKPAGSVAVIGSSNEVVSQIATTVLGSYNIVAGKAEAEVPNQGVFVGGLGNKLTNVTGAVVIGNRSEIKDHTNFVAIGSDLQVHGDTTIAIGSEAKVLKDNAIAFGSGARVEVESGIAIGAGSVSNRTGNVKGWDPLGRTSFGTDTAWNSYYGAVSVGEITSSYVHTRQITNVSAGSEDTDAVNVAQLKAAVSSVAFDIVGNGNITVNTETDPTTKKRTFTISAANSTVESGDGIIKVNTPEGSQAQIVTAEVGFIDDAGNKVTLGGSSTAHSSLQIKGGVTDPASLTANNIGVVADAESGALSVKLASDLKNLKSVDTASLTATNATVANSLKVGAGDALTTITGGSLQTSAVTAQTVTAGAFTAGTASMLNTGFVIAGGPSLTAAELSMAGKQIRNVGAGTALTDAVNLGQLQEQMKAAVQNAVNSIEIAAGDNITVTDKTNSETGKRTFTISSANNIESGDGIIEVKPKPSTGSDSESASNAADGGEGSEGTTSTGSQTTQVITAKVGFVGDTGSVTLAGSNTTLKIKGGVTDSAGLTDDNIGVVADGTDTLKIKLASDLKALNSVETKTLTATDTLKVGSGDVLTTITGRAVTSSAFTAGASTMSSNGFVISEGPKFTKSEIDLAGNVLHRVGTGELDTDAVNVGQLNSAIQSAVESMHFEIIAGENVTVASATDPTTGKRTYTISAANNVESGDGIIEVTPRPSTGAGSVSTEEAPSAGGSGSTGGTTVSGTQTTQVVTAKVGFVGDTGSVTLGGSTGAPSSLNIKGGATGDLTDGNIGVVASGNDTLNVKLAADLTGLNSVETKTLTTENATVKDTLTVGSGSETTTITGSSVTAETVSATTLKAGDTTVSTDGVSVAGGPTLTKSEVSMAGNQIHDVAEGTAPTDAVNVRQLNRSLSDLGSRITKAQHENRAGIASAMAMASLGQPYQSGKSMLSAGASYYKGQSGFALGVSSTSANGSWLVRLAGTGNTEGDFGVAGSVNFAW